MRTLTIECATEACSVALFEAGQLVDSAHRVLGRGHAEQLVPMIAALPDRGRAERILVSLGPGSFTGVRIGLATARALGFAWNAEVLGYPTLALVGAMALEERSEQAVTVCMTGGHGEWFVQDFAQSGMPLGELVSITPAAAAEAPVQPLVAGSQAEALAALHRGRATPLPLLPNAAAAHLLDRAQLSPARAPIYGRGPDARLPG